jgi:molybdenum-dependent DNA-binding transcriptional regulator ModE
MPTLVRDLQDRLLELYQLRNKSLARHDAVQAEELQAEIEELTAYLDEVFGAAAVGA